MNIHARSWEEPADATSLARRYRQKDASVDAWFGGWWDQLPHWRQTADRLHHPPRPHGRWADLLARQAKGFGPVPTESLDRLNHPGALVVMTGQQVGLGGGPLYTWWKALTAIQTARRYERELGCPVVPVFWMAADDHDVEEIRSCRILDQWHDLRSIGLPQAAASHVPASGLALTREVDGAWAELEHAMPVSEFSGGVLDALRRCYAPGETFVTAFGRWMSRCFEGTGLLMANPSDPEMKSLARDLFIREAETHPASRAACDERTRALAAAGFPAQVHLPPDVHYLMWMDGGRHPLRERNGALERNGRPTGWTRPEWVAQIAAHPERVSPNVLWNPVYQSGVFPVVALVVGPSEIAYHAQMRPLYDRFQLVPPILVPRVTATLVEERVEKGLGERGVSVDRVVTEGETALTEVKREAVPRPLREGMVHLRDDLHRHRAALTERLGQFDGSLVGMWDRMAGGFEGHLNKLDEKLAQSAERKDAALGRHMKAAINGLKPEGRLQERVLCGLSFLMRHGWGLIPCLLAHWPEDVTRHHALVVSQEGPRE